MIFRLLLLLTVSVAAQGAETERALAASIIDRYGANKLLEMNAFSFRERFRHLETGQSYYPGQQDAKLNQLQLDVDFAAQKKSLYTQGIRNQKPHFQHRIYRPNGSLSINHSSKRYRENNSKQFSDIDGSASRHIDLYWAKLISLHPNSVVGAYAGEYFGRPVSIATLDLKAYPKATIYVAQDGRILSLQVDESSSTHHFSNHQSVHGVLFSRDFHISKSNTISSVASQRDLILGPLADAVFELPAGYKAANLSHQTQSNTLQMKALAKGVYHVGRDFDFSLFVDAGDHYYGVGGYKGIKERLEYLNQQLGLNKPLKYMVATHHHSDHLGAMAEAAKMGASFISSAQAQATVKAAVKQDLDDSRFLTVGTKLSLLDGRIQIVNFPNGHSAHHLLFVLPKDNILFSEDLYFATDAHGAPKGGPQLESLSSLFAQQQWDIKQFAAAHSDRVLSASDFQYSLDNMEDEPRCPPTWDFCQL